MLPWQPQRMPAHVRASLRPKKSRLTPRFSRSSDARVSQCSHQRAHLSNVADIVCPAISPPPGLMVVIAFSSGGLQAFASWRSLEEMEWLCRGLFCAWRGLSDDRVRRRRSPRPFNLVPSLHRDCNCRNGRQHQSRQYNGDQRKQCHLYPLRGDGVRGGSYNRAGRVATDGGTVYFLRR